MNRLVVFGDLGLQVAQIRLAIAAADDFEMERDVIGRLLGQGLQKQAAELFARGAA